MSSTSPINYSSYSESEGEDVTAKLQAEVLRLSAKWTFWYDRGLNQEAGDARKGMTKIGSFDTVQYYWRYANYIAIDKMPLKSNLRLFQASIEPVWEDPSNSGGGRLIIVIKKRSTEIIWSNILASVVGHTMLGCESINGLVLSIRKMGNVIQIWMRASDKETQNKIKSEVKEICSLDKGAVESISFQVMETLTSTTVKKSTRKHKENKQNVVNDNTSNLLMHYEDSTSTSVIDSSTLNKHSADASSLSVTFSDKVDKKREKKESHVSKSHTGWSQPVGFRSPATIALMSPPLKLPGETAPERLRRLGLSSVDMEPISSDLGNKVLKEDTVSPCTLISASDNLSISTVSTGVTNHDIDTSIQSCIYFLDTNAPLTNSKDITSHQIEKGKLSSDSFICSSELLLPVHTKSMLVKPSVKQFFDAFKPPEQIALSPTTVKSMLMEVVDIKSPSQTDDLKDSLNSHKDTQVTLEPIVIMPQTMSSVIGNGEKNVEKKIANKKKTLIDPTVVASSTTRTSSDIRNNSTITLPSLNRDLQRHPAIDLPSSGRLKRLDNVRPIGLSLGDGDRKWTTVVENFMDSASVNNIDKEITAPILVDAYYCRNVGPISIESFDTGIFSPILKSSEPFHAPLILPNINSTTNFLSPASNSTKDALVPSDNFEAGHDSHRYRTVSNSVFVGLTSILSTVVLLIAFALYSYVLSLDYATGNIPIPKKMPTSVTFVPP